LRPIFTNHLQKNFEKLLQNIPKSDFIHTYNICIGNKIKEIEFVQSSTMTKQIDCDVSKIKSPDGSFHSNMYTIDDQFNLVTDDHIELLKIDVEGNEMLVLEGATETLMNQKVDLVYIECGLSQTAKQQTYFCKIDKFMQNVGYRVLKFYEQTHEWFTNLAVLRRVNACYMSNEFANHHPLKVLQKNYSIICK